MRNEIYSSIPPNRVVAVGLVPLTIAPFAAGTLNPVMDAALCSILVLHSHIGFQYDPATLKKRNKAMGWLTFQQGFYHRLLPQAACAQDPRALQLAPPYLHPLHSRRIVRVRDE